MSRSEVTCDIFLMSFCSAATMTQHRNKEETDKQTCPQIRGSDRNKSATVSSLHHVTFSDEEAKGFNKGFNIQKYWFGLSNSVWMKPLKLYGSHLFYQTHHMRVYGITRSRVNNGKGFQEPILYTEPKSTQHHTVSFKV